MNHCAICTARIEDNTELCEVCCNLERTVADLKKQKTGQREYVERVVTLERQLSERKAGNDER